MSDSHRVTLVQVYIRGLGGNKKATLYGEEYAGKHGEVIPVTVLYDGYGHYDLLYWA